MPAFVAEMTSTIFTPPATSENSTEVVIVSGPIGES
jgi:hypothetical protein